MYEKHISKQTFDLCTMA